MSEANDKPMYGIWITGSGWMRGEKDVISFYDRSFALEVANIMNAKIRRIDDSYKDLEQFYLAQEGKSLWRTFQNLFNNKQKSFNNSK